MARVQTKAEISPATAALVFFLVLAVACYSLWYFVIQQPFPKFSPPAIAPTSQESPRSAGEKPPSSLGGSKPAKPAGSAPASGGQGS